MVYCSKWDFLGFLDSRILANCVYKYNVAFYGHTTYLVQYLSHLQATVSTEFLWKHLAQNQQLFYPYIGGDLNEAWAEGGKNGVCHAVLSVLEQNTAAGGSCHLRLEKILS